VKREGERQTSVAVVSFRLLALGSFLSFDGGGWTFSSLTVSTTTGAIICGSASSVRGGLLYLVSRFRCFPSAEGDGASGPWLALLLVSDLRKSGGLILTVVGMRSNLPFVFSNGWNRWTERGGRCSLQWRIEILFEPTPGLNVSIHSQLGFIISLTHKTAAARTIGCGLLWTAKDERLNCQLSPSSPLRQTRERKGQT